MYVPAVVDGHASVVIASVVVVTWQEMLAHLAYTSKVISMDDHVAHDNL